MITRKQKRDTINRDAKLKAKTTGERCTYDVESKDYNRKHDAKDCQLQQSCSVKMEEGNWEDIQWQCGQLFAHPMASALTTFSRVQRWTVLPVERWRSSPTKNFSGSVCWPMGLLCPKSPIQTPFDAVKRCQRQQW
jgi:hypothetical protein